MTELNEVMDLFERVGNDLNVPKGLKTRMEDAKALLMQEDRQTGVRINQALEKLEEISDDSNTPDHLRIQIWNIVSILESVK